jgi:ATP-dependent Clp protease ATP-binding subunit ClpC
MMRPAGLARQDYFGPTPADLIDAQRRAEFCVNRMVDAIANHKFEQARFYSSEDLKAREHLQRVRRKYGLA